ncbi:MAG: tRNA guanosine(34) transglycosylase Tgt [Anaerolineae bacterium]|nr:tRNA guanosine(34) transglycosylase Tgt [Anaerolineae bacterium]
MGRLETLETGHGAVALPAFFPDATRAVVRSLDARDLEECGVQGLIVNTFHLTYAPGVGLVKSQGGVHAFMGWERPVISDSGGFQAMSMVRENARYGRISDAGITFTNIDAKGRSRLRLTPEKCIQIQFDLGSDIMICLDDCPRADADADQVADAVRRTVLWARRCKAEFVRQVEMRALTEAPPRLFAIVQGGYSKRHRWECAEALIEIGFDGYGFGGWPLDLAGNLAESTLDYTARLMPDGLPKYALGVGNPAAVVRCAEMGYDLFDCVLPTRDARHQRLYYFSDGAESLAYEHLYIGDDKYKRDPRPVSQVCDCLCCTRYSRSYLNHLFSIQDRLAARLATIHNLRFYTQLMTKLRARRDA